MQFSRMTHDADETRAIGAALGRLLRPGDVLLLRGELGAGKTTFTQGIAAGTGTDEVVNSPTFILVNEYRGHVRLYHADLYRLDRPQEVAMLDLSGSTVEGALVVEWPERGMEFLPPEHVLVDIAHRGVDSRELRFLPAGRRAEALVEELAAALAG